MITATKDEMIDTLPESMQIAQRAIHTKEVQDIMRQLAPYNLGVCMPHMHVEEGKFTELPKDMVVLERTADFIPATEADPESTISVAWRWADGEVVTAGSCHTLRKRCGVA